MHGMNHPLLWRLILPFPAQEGEDAAASAMQLPECSIDNLTDDSAAFPIFKTNITSLLITIEYTSVWDSDNPTK